MKRKAVIHIELPSEKMVKTLFKALLPETEKPSTSRSKISIEGESKKLILQIEAKDTSALRAALNSYLRWVSLVRNIYKAVEDLEKASQV